MNASRQHGAVLGVSLILLAVLTLLASEALRLSTTNLRVVGNSQLDNETESAVQDAIENFVGTTDNFAASTCDPAAQDLSLYGTTFNVNIDEPTCLHWENAPGYSESFTLAPITTHWNLRAVGRHNPSGTAASGSALTLHQGVSVQLPADNCPAVRTNSPCS